MSKLLWISTACAIAAIALAFTQVSTQSAVRFAGAADSVVVPFVLRSNHVLVRGAIGDSDSLWFIVDSGAGSHCVDMATAKRLGMDVGGGVEARGTGGTVKAGAVHDVRYGVTGCTVDAPFAAAIDLEAVALQIGVPVGGVLGFPLFDHTVATFDYEKSRLVLHQPSFQPAGAMLPLSFHDNHPYVDAKLTLPGRNAEEGSFVLDTGASWALTLTPAYVEASKAMDAVTKTMETRMGGVGGLSYQPMGRLERLELGPYALEQPVAILPQPGAPGRVSIDGSFGNIGGDVLQRFRVTFDYPRKQVRLVPGAAFARAFEADMTGMILTARPDGDHPVEIVKVVPGSPAADAGVTAGDILASVDGRPFAAADLAEFRQRTKTEGEALRLGLLRGARKTEVTLTTRRMI